jgi:SAM-dependent methyltransferase
MNPRFDDMTITEMYGRGYYEGSAAFAYNDERIKEKYADYVWCARLRTIRRFAPRGNLLDIGAAFGGFMHAAQRWFTPYGIELSEYSGKIAKERFGSHLHVGTLDNHPFPKEFFSVITMIECIEHLAEPLSALRECYKLLAPAGVLVIQTADCAAWQAIDAGSSYHYYLPGHLSCFTERSLCEALLHAGFSSYKIFRPVDFGLLPKLRKMRGDFTSLKDYYRWITASLYHFKGFIRKKGKPLTSSMVVYAVK